MDESEAQSQRVKRRISGLALLVLFSRLPFLGPGLGSDGDGWSLSVAARQLVERGIYTPSRFPGNPVVEFALALLYSADLSNPVFINGISACFSVTAFFFMALISIELKRPLPAMTGIALACVPLVYENSVNAMDYVWAMALALGGLWLVLKNRPLAAGYLLGCAIGCRITSGGLLLPYAWLLWVRSPRELRIRRDAAFSCATLATAALWFAMALRTYGLSFLVHYQDPYPSLTGLLRRASAEVWGQTGAIAVAGGLAWGAYRLLAVRAAVLPDREAKQELAAWFSILALYWIAFLKLPSQAGYLIITVPFTLLILNRLLGKRACAACCAMIIASPFMVRIGPGGFAPGRIFEDHASRVERMRWIDGFIAKAKSLPKDALIVCGPDWGATAGTLMIRRQGNDRFVESKRTDRVSDCYIWLTSDSGRRIGLVQYLRKPLLTEFASRQYAIYYTHSPYQYQEGHPVGTVWEKFDLREFGAARLEE